MNETSSLPAHRPAGRSSRQPETADATDTLKCPGIVEALVAKSVAAAVLAAAIASTIATTGDPVVVTLSLAAVLVAASTGALTPASRASKHAGYKVAYRTLRTRLVDLLSLDVFVTETELHVVMDPAQPARLREKHERYSEETNTLDSTSPEMVVRDKFNPRCPGCHGANAWFGSEAALTESTLNQRG